MGEHKSSREIGYLTLESGYWLGVGGLSILDGVGFDMDENLRQDSIVVSMSS